MTVSMQELISQDFGKRIGRKVEKEEVVETIAPTPSRISVGQSKWERVNNIFCQNGFSAVNYLSLLVSNFEEDCHVVLSDIVSNYERREKLVQVEERNHMHIQQLESKRDEVVQNLSITERRAKVASKTAERNYGALRRDWQKLESSNANLIQQLADGFSYKQQPARTCLPGKRALTAKIARQDGIWRSVGVCVCLDKVLGEQEWKLGDRGHHILSVHCCGRR